LPMAYRSQATVASLRGLRRKFSWPLLTVRTRYSVKSHVSLSRGREDDWSIRLIVQIRLPLDTALSFSAARIRPMEAPTLASELERTTFCQSLSGSAHVQFGRGSRSHWHRAACPECSWRWRAGNLQRRMPSDRAPIFR